MFFFMFLLAQPRPLHAGGILKRPSPEKLAEIRDRIRAQQAERDALRERQALIPWKQLAISPDQLAGDKAVLIHLANSMNLYRAVWTFTPAAGNPARPVRLPQCWRGAQWIALPPGAWEATVAIGRPNGSRAIRVPIAPLTGRRGEVYELALTGAVEQAVMALERAEARKREESAKHLQAPPESKDQDEASPDEADANETR